MGATYEVMLVGGVEGVRAEDGRSMPDTYRWSFTVVDPANAEAALIAPEPAGSEAPIEEGSVPGTLPGTSTTLYLPLIWR